jgi:hypothetical protein
MKAYPKAQASAIRPALQITAGAEDVFEGIMV